MVWEYGSGARGGQQQPVKNPNLGNDAVLCCAVLCTGSLTACWVMYWTAASGTWGHHRLALSMCQGKPC